MFYVCTLLISTYFNRNELILANVNGDNLDTSNQKLLIKVAVNEALSNAQKTTKEKMSARELSEGC